MSPDGLRHQLTARARDLRQEATAAEQALWDLLRNRTFRGLKFRRQAPIKGYIADFYCAEQRLVIELDGGVHERKEQKLRDADRDVDLEVHGYRVLRFRNEAVLQRPEEVLQALGDWLDG
ncbi:MAG: endonuclease domain-containing protein [Acidobacteriota bacterium]|nr:endonuclease domain-containing protein [Acidobacteriota bacterium]